jgi:pimeloyl-ACP methyl ester carboxylesterase
MIVIVIVIVFLVTLPVGSPSSVGATTTFESTFQYSEQDYLLYEVLGTGEIPVVFLHGFGTSARTWDRLLQHLPAEGCTFYFLNLKGCGGSSSPHDAMYSTLDQARLVAQFIAQNELVAPIVVGHSMGGAVALILATMALDDPELTIDSLVLLDPAAYADDIPGYVRSLRDPVLGWAIVRLFTPEQLVSMTFQGVFYDTSKLTDEIITTYANALQRSDYRYVLPQTAQSVVPPGFEGIVSDYASVSIPVLIIWGENDQLRPADNGSRLAADLQQASLQLIPECGHNPQDEQPEVSARFIDEFIRSRGDRAICGS